MAVVPMQKINLLVHQSDKPKVLAFLQEKAVLQITDVGELEEGLQKLELDKEGHDLEYRVAELDFAIQFLSEYEEKKKGLQAMIDGDSVKSGFDELKKIAENYQFEDMVERCKSIEEEMVNLKNEVKSIHVLQDKLTPWKNLKYPLDTPPETESSMALYTSAPLKDWEPLKTEVPNLSKSQTLEDAKFIII